MAAQPRSLKVKERRGKRIGTNDDDGRDCRFWTVSVMHRTRIFVVVQGTLSSTPITNKFSCIYRTLETILHEEVFESQDATGSSTAYCTVCIGEFIVPYRVGFKNGSIPESNQLLFCKSSTLYLVKSELPSERLDFGTLYLRV